MTEANIQGLLSLSSYRMDLCTPQNQYIITHPKHFTSILKSILTSKELVERLKTRKENRLLLSCARYLILELRISVSPHFQHHIEKAWWKNKSPSIWRTWAVHTDNTLEDTTALQEECQYTEWTFLWGQTLMSHQMTLQIFGLSNYNTLA